MDNKYAHVMHLGNPTNTIAVLNRYGFNFQKKFGQNFLIDENVVEKIVREAGVTKDDFVLEVGPGIGTMTQILCENAREVVAVEIDKKLIPILTEDTLSWYDNVTVINEDILKLDNSARMNFPSSFGNNWKWRMQKGQLNWDHLNAMRYLASVFDRERN